MADPRQQLLQSLMQDLENFQLPERFDEAKKAQIMKGRKGQADIDAGRAAIRENEQLYQQAVEQRRALQTQIGTVQTEIDNAKGTARTQSQEDWERSPTGQAYETAKIGVPIAAGMTYGHKAASNIESRFQNMRPADRAAMGRAGRFAPYGAKAMTYLVPEGIALREWVAPGMQEGTGKDLVNAAGTGLVAAGAVTMGEGAVRAFTPQKLPGEAATLPPGSPPPDRLPPPDAPPTRVPNSQRLINAAKAAGATGKLTKAQAEAYLKKAGVVTDANRQAVAEALGAKPGEKLPGVMKRLGSTRGASSIIAPLIAGGLTYDAVSSEARAEGSTPSEARTRGAVAGTGAAAATTGALAAGKAAGDYLGPRMATNALGRVALRAVPVAGAALTGYDAVRGVNALAHMSPPQDPGEYSTMGAFMPPQNALAAAGPGAEEAEPSYPRSGPMMQASRLELPQNVPPDATQQANIASAFDPAMRGQPNPLAQAGEQQQKDPFGIALDEFMAFIQQEMAQEQGAQQ